MSRAELALKLGQEFYGNMALDTLVGQRAAWIGCNRARERERKRVRDREEAGLEIDYCSGNICIVLWRVVMPCSTTCLAVCVRQLTAERKSITRVLRDYETILDLENQTTSGSEEVVVGWGLNCLPTERKRERERRHGAGRDPLPKTEIMLWTRRPATTATTTTAAITHKYPENCGRGIRAKI